jgi:hypothetical protein
VPEFDKPIQEALELLEHGIVDAAQLCDFLFVNPVRFYASLNPEFFSGFTVEKKGGGRANGLTGSCHRGQPGTPATGSCDPYASTCDTTILVGVLVSSGHR